MGRVKKNRGFTLIEAAVAIGVVAILAGMIAPLGIKILDRQREEATRKSVQMIFEALFGSKERRVENMRADCRFLPVIPPGDGDFWVDLNIMVVPSHAYPLYVYPRLFGPDSGLPAGQPPQSFAWGWRGPYWLGPVNANHQPLDAWGHPIVLFVRRSNGTVQVHSDGRTGSRDQMATHINYPIAPVPLSNFNCSVTLNITTRDHQAALVGSYSVRGAGLGPRLGGNPHLNEIPWAQSYVMDGNRQEIEQLFTDIVPGSMDVCIVPRTPADFATRVFPFDMLPGEKRVIDFQL